MQANVAPIATTFKPDVANVETDGSSDRRYVSMMLKDWVVSAIAYKGISQASLARELTERLGRSIDRAAVNKMTKGTRDVAGDEMLAVAEITGLAAPVSQQGLQLIRVMGRIGAGAEIMPEFEQLPPEGLFEIETMIPMPDGAIAFEVDGDSMWPRYDPGDVVICWRDGTPIEEVLGYEAAVRTADGRRFLKRILRGSDASTYDLESHNAAPIRGVRLEWVSGVGHVIRRGQWARLNEAGKKRAIKKAAR